MKRITQFFFEGESPTLTRIVPFLYLVKFWLFGVIIYLKTEKIAFFSCLVRKLPFMIQINVVALKQNLCGLQIAILKKV